MRLSGGALAYKKLMVKYNLVLSSLYASNTNASATFPCQGRSSNGKSIVLHLQSFLDVDLRCALRVCNALYGLYSLTISEMSWCAPYSLSIPLIIKLLIKQSYMPLPFSVGGKHDRNALWLQNLIVIKYVSCWSCLEFTRWSTRIHRVFRYTWQRKSSDRTLQRHDSNGRSCEDCCIECMQESCRSPKDKYSGYTLAIFVNAMSLSIKQSAELLGMMQCK